MADGATDISCVEEENCVCRVQNDNTTVAKRKPEKKKNCKSCVYNCDDLLSYNSSPRNSHNDFHYIHNSRHHPFMGL